MAHEAAHRSADFVVALGDNFYDDGVKSTTDHRWKSTFEDVYSDKSLQKKWYVLAGNHDHYGNVQAQVDYTKISDRWTFPSLYYSFTKTAPNGHTVQFVMIDTVTLAGGIDDAEMCSKNSSRCQLNYPGPADPVAAEDQMSWIKATMANSTADHLIVCGHYPVYSVAEHGSTANLVANLKPLLDEHKAHYMNGHEHTMEFIQPKGEFTGYYTTGAAHGCDPSQAHTDTIPKGSLQFHGCKDGGFTRMEVNDDGMTVFYYDGTGKRVFQAPTKSIRTKALLSPPQP